MTTGSVALGSGPAGYQLWHVLLARGALALVFGIVALLWPVTTIVALVVLWGFWAFVEGVSLLVQAVRPGPGAARAVLALSGVVSLAAAFLAIFRPGLTATTLTWVLGIWLVVRGLSELFTAFGPGAAGARGLVVLSALLDLVLGVLFVANPGRGALSVATVLGVLALCWGAILLGMAWSARREATGATAPPAQPAAT